MAEACEARRLDMVGENPEGQPLRYEKQRASEQLGALPDNWQGWALPDNWQG